MNRELVVSPQASHDEDEISLCLAQNAGEATALRFLDALRDTYQQLTTMPGMGARVRGLRGSRLQDLRRWQVQGFTTYLVFYRADDEFVHVVRVLHGSRDILAILENEEA